MAELPRNYLDKKGSWKPVKLLDLAILLYHVHKGAKDEEVGFLDARETLESLTKALNRTVYVDKSHLESAIWSANMLSEHGKFWHPTLTFEQFVKDLVGADVFHKVYGTIEKKE